MHMLHYYIFYIHWSFIIPHQPRSESDDYHRNFSLFWGVRGMLEASFGSHTATIIIVNIELLFPKDCFTFFLRRPSILLINFYDFLSLHERNMKMKKKTEITQPPNKSINDSDDTFFSLLRLYLNEWILIFFFLFFFFVVGDYMTITWLPNGGLFF